MNASDVRFVMEFIFKKAGIVLSADKTYFVEARLAPVARANGLASPSEVVQQMMRGDRRLEQTVLDALTTNETFFFRDKTPFEHLENLILPSLHSTRGAGQPIRIWSAACSSGQEPFSIAMMLENLRGKFGDRRFEIYASDISESMLARARAGVFNQFEVQRGLPTKLLLQFFTKDGDVWKIADPILRRVNFFPCNLMQDPNVPGKFDVVFCRNVLIYFDRPARQQVLARLADRMQDDGVLLLGGAESIYGISDRFAPHPKERSLYIPVPRAGGLRVAAGA